MSSHPAQT